MDAFFTPICVIVLVCLLFECLSLILDGIDMALSCRFIIVMLLYLAYILKRDLIRRALKHKSRKMLQFHNYVIFVCCTVSTLFHAILFCVLPLFRLYCVCVVVTSFPVALDECQEIEWLKERDSLCCIEEDGDETSELDLRPSIYYALYRWLQTVYYKQWLNTPESPV